MDNRETEERPNETGAIIAPEDAKKDAAGSTSDISQQINKTELGKKKEYRLNAADMCSSMYGTYAEKVLDDDSKREIIHLKNAICWLDLTGTMENISAGIYFAYWRVKFGEHFYKGSDAPINVTITVLQNGFHVPSNFLGFKNQGVQEIHGTLDTDYKEGRIFEETQEVDIPAESDWGKWENIKIGPIMVPSDHDSTTVLFHFWTREGYWINHIYWDYVELQEAPEGYLHHFKEARKVPESVPDVSQPPLCNMKQ